MDYKQFWKMIEKIVEAINLLNESLEKIVEVINLLNESLEKVLEKVAKNE